MADDTVSRTLHSVARGAGVMFIGTMVSKAIMYFYRLVVARWLGPADYGLLSLALSVFWLSVTISHMGVPAGVERYVSDYIGREDEEGIKGMVYAGLGITLPWSLIVAAGVFLSAGTISRLAFHEPSLAIYLKAFALGIPFQILYKNMEKVVQAFREFRYEVYVDRLFRSLATLGVTLALFYLGFGLMGAVLAQLVSIVLSSLLILYFLESRVRSLFRSSTSPEFEPRKLVSFSWPLFLSGVIGTFVGKVDTFMLGYFDAARTVGIYNAALPTAQLLMVVGGTFSTALFPNVSQLYGRERKEDAIRLASTALKWMFSIVFPALLLMVLFARPGLRLLFGHEYVGAAVALSILGTAYFLNVMMNYAGSFIKAEDRTRLTALNTGAVSVLNIGLNYLLIPIYGLSGAALATASAMAFGGFLAAFEVYYLFGVQPFELRRFAAPFLASVLSAGGVYAVTERLFRVTPVWVLVPAFFAFLLLYAVLF
ncbi:MAG: oligosaccharide flippase family protein, partial [Candidatus Nanohaloarchaea archaeon]|nr:oligosaccharide flippase family protein [Candidatus Nanohaloarchaea archaeon]